MPVGYLKGGTIAGQNLVFDVRNTPGTASEFIIYSKKTLGPEIQCVSEIQANTNFMVIDLKLFKFIADGVHNQDDACAW